MEWASNFIVEIYKYLHHRDDTAIDRLNRLYTVALLSAFVTLISSQQYIVGSRIVCWTPTDFSGAQVTYAHDICWLGRMNYYIPENFTTLESPSSVRAYPFLIYPWLPIILIGMTASFAGPYLLLWHGLSTRSGLDIRRLTKIDRRDELAAAIDFVLSKRYLLKRTGGIYIISIYFLMKICYILILFGQLILINQLLIGDYWQTNLRDNWKILSVKYNMWSSAHFPIETMCDFMVRMLGQNNNWFTMQCILPFNLFTKRIFALLTIWFLILLVLNLFDLVFIWLYKRIWLSSRRYEYIQTLFHLYEIHLHNESSDPEIILAMDEQRYSQEFVYNYLGIDGYFLLKLLHTNQSDMNMSYLVVNLFKRFVRENISQWKNSIKPNDHTAV